MRSPPSTDSSRKAWLAPPATRRNAPTGVCKSASTLRTTGTTFPRAASRSNSSNVAGVSPIIFIQSGSRSALARVGFEPPAPVAAVRHNLEEPLPVHLESRPEAALRLALHPLLLARKVVAAAVEDKAFFHRAAAARACLSLSHLFPLPARRYPTRRLDPSQCPPSTTMTAPLM